MNLLLIAQHQVLLDPVVLWALIGGIIVLSATNIYVAVLTHRRYNEIGDLLNEDKQFLMTKNACRKAIEAHEKGLPIETIEKETKEEKVEVDLKEEEKPKKEKDNGKADFGDLSFRVPTRKKKLKRR